jgi:hypothetical protein
MESRNDVDGEAVSGEDTKTPREARIDASERMAASFPIVTRSYEPVADLDELLRHIFALLSLPPTEE